MFRARVSPLLWHAPGKTAPPCSTRQGTPPVAVPCYHGASVGLSIREFSTWSLRSSIRNRLDLVAFSRIYVSRGFSTASGPFRPFGGAVDIVVVEQQDGSFRCSPWYVKFGKFQGVLRRQERIVAVSVNDVDAGFNMYLNRKGDVYFLKDTMNEHFDDERLNARDVKSSDSEEILLDVKNEPDTEVFKVDLTAENRMAGGFVRWYRRRRFMKRRLQTLIPTSEQLASLNLKDGKNKITFTFFTHVLGKRQLDAGIYLMKWNAKIVISDVDGTITKSDVLGQFMPLLGRDWSQTGVTRLFSAIKDNGYKLIFLSSRAISQANRTRKFLISLKQDGEQLPDGPVVMSPDGIFPSLYREVVQRTPHEFKIECLQEIRSLFPSNYNPFYAGFGNRDTDVISYLKVGIPMGKIFTINPKGELIVNNAVDVKCYASLHKLLDEMFPPVEECGAWGSCGLRDKDSTGNARILDVLAAEIRSMLEEDMGVPVLIISCDIPRAESSHFIE